MKIGKQIILLRLFKTAFAKASAGEDHLRKSYGDQSGVWPRKMRGNWFGSFFYDNIIRGVAPQDAG